MNIIICDDDKNTLSYLESLICKHYGNMHTVFSFSNAEDLLQLNVTANLLLLDIRLGQTNGIELSKLFLNKQPDCKIIFITGYPMEYYEEIFEHFRPYGYIGKPIREELLFKRIDNISRILSSNQKLDFVCKGNNVSLNPNNIIYIESHGRQKFVTTQNETFIVNLSFDEFDKLLPEYFSRCHNAFIINLNYISNYKNDNIVITNGKIIPVGRKYKYLFKDKYFKYKEKENGTINF